MQPEEEKWTQPTQQQSGAPLYTAQQSATPTEAQVTPEPVQQPATMQPQAQAMPVENAAESQISTAPDGLDDQISWQATEYIQRAKGGVWYIVFAVVVLGLIALSIFVMKSITFAILIVVMAVALVVYAMRPPALHNYTLSRKGLHIDDQLYPFEKYKEFGLVSGDDQHSIMLIPRERFKPGVTIYFPEEVGEGLVDMLAARLPMKEVKLDQIDKIIRLLRI